MECPNGEYKEEFQRLMTKAKGFAQILATSKLSRQEAKTLYFTTFVSSMNYSGAIGTLTLEQTEQIQGAVTQQFVAKMGFNRCLPSAITYGPPSLGGLGLRHLFHKQNTEKTIFIIRLLRMDRPASKILQIQLAWAQLVSGISKPILEDTSKPLPHLENELWVSSLRQYLSASFLQVHIVHVTHKDPKCINDTFLMDQACTMGYSDKKLCMINRCRIYLRAETLADVSSYSGKTIDAQALECNAQARIISPYIWPAQPRPGLQHRKVWKQFLQTFCHIGTLQLETPLGKWTCIDIPKRAGCSTFFHPTENQALRVTHGNIETAEITVRHTYKTIGTFKSYDLQTGSTLIPADAQERNGKYFLE
jgi:hypothetical protein